MLRMSSSESRQRSLLSRRLTIALATPLLLLVALGAILGRQILQLADDMHWVDHTDEVLATANDTTRQIIDQETGLRGYLLTADRAFLEPYTRARPLDGFARLHDLTSVTPTQQARFDEARQRYERWFAIASPVAEGHGVESGKTMEAMRERKTRMDGVRESLRSAIEIEESLHRERAAASANSIATTRVVFVVLIAASAAILAFLSRRNLAPSRPRSVLLSRRNGRRGRQRKQRSGFEQVMPTSARRYKGRRASSNSARSLSRRSRHTSARTSAPSSSNTPAHGIDEQAMPSIPERRVRRSSRRVKASLGALRRAARCFISARCRATF